jgi:hypothetical protein
MLFRSHLASAGVSPAACRCTDPNYRRNGGLARARGRAVRPSASRPSDRGPPQQSICADWRRTSAIASVSACATPSAIAPHNACSTSVRSRVHLSQLIRMPAQLLLGNQGWPPGNRACAVPLTCTPIEAGPDKVQCPSWVNRVTLTARRSLPVFPN